MAQETAITLPSGPLPADFRASIDAELQRMVPPGRKGAVIGVATKDGFVIGVAHRLNDTWAVGADVEKRWSGPVAGKVWFVGSW